MSHPDDDTALAGETARTRPGSGPDVPLVEERGRPGVLVPTPPGFWRLILGVSVAALGPLFGFLMGGMSGPQVGEEPFNRLYLGLFIGMVVGGLGLLLAFSGGVRLYRHYHQRADEEDEDHLARA